MEMKRRQKRVALKTSDQGFTIVELLVAMVISLLALGAIYSTFLAQHRSYQVQEEASDMQQNIRTAMFYMQREIRMAGSNPFKSLPLASFGITAAGQNTITITEDITGNADGGPDGDVSDSEENITYALNGTDLTRTDNNAVPPDSQIVAQNINWLDFVYLDADSNVIAFDATNSVPAANLDQIRSVEITIVAKTDDQLLYGATNKNVYQNQQGTASFVANDQFSRRRLTTEIHCRNLGL
jgi:type IV pilus assembly protein PilW